MSRLTKWEAFREMEDFFRQFRPWVAAGTGGSMMEWRPDANISKLDNEYLIKADLPEVRKEDVKIALQNGVLTITGERKLEKEAKGEDRIRIESYYGSFERSFELPDDVDEKSIKAETRDGVLCVHLPRKKGAPEPKAISVQIQ
jgi:HSP20 family protein